MPVLTSIAATLGTTTAAISTGLTAAGAVAGIAGTVQQNQAEKRAESIRRTQMLQESARRQREIFRQQQVARATILSNASNTGIQDSSAFGGAIGQVDTQAGQQSIALQENTDNSLDLFSANADSAAGRSLRGFGQDLGALGKGIASVQNEIVRVGGSIGPWITSVNRA